MTDVTPNAPKEMAVWLGSELAGHLDQKAWPVESFDSQMTPLEERLKKIQFPGNLSSLYIRAEHFDFIGLKSGGDRLFYLGGDLRAAYMSGRDEDIGISVRAIYSDAVLSFENNFLEKTECGEAWVKVFNPDGRFIGVLRPSYVADFLSENIDLGRVNVKLKRLRAVENKPEKYKIRGDIISSIDNSVLEKIDGLFGRDATISHDEIKFVLDYAREMGFDVIPYAKKPEGYASPGEKTVVLPKGTPATSKLNRNIFKRELLYVAGATLVGLAAGAFLFYNNGCNGCESEEGAEVVRPEDRTVVKRMPEDSTKEEKTGQDVLSSQEIPMNPESIKPKPADNTKKIAGVPEKAKTRIQPNRTLKRAVSERENTRKQEIRIADGRTSDAAKRRTTSSTGAATTRRTVTEPAGESFLYPPPVREGDPFYDEFKDDIDTYLQGCADDGGSDNEGAFVLDYLVGVYGEVTNARIREGISGRPIPTKCADGLRGILLNQNLSTSSSGLYTSRDVIDLGGE